MRYDAQSFACKPVGKSKMKMMLYLISGDPYNLFCHRNTDMTTT